MKIEKIITSIFLTLLLISIISVKALPITTTRLLTINHGDPYYCEDPNDPYWVWNLDQVQNGLIIVENDFIANDDTDFPVGEGRFYPLPNNYARIYFDEQLEGASAAVVSIRNKSNNILDSATISPGNGIATFNMGVSNVYKLDESSVLVLGRDSPSIENAETSSDYDYGDDLFMEVIRASIQSVSIVYPDGKGIFKAKVLGDNLEFRINDDNSITLVDEIHYCKKF